LENILLLALALMLIIEGLMPMLFPETWRETFLNLTKYRNGQIRFFWVFVDYFRHNTIFIS